MSETPSEPAPAHAGDSSVEVVDEAAPAPNGAYPRPHGFSGVWPPEVIEEIQEKAALGRYQIRGQATKRQGLPSFDDLVFVPAGLSRMPLEGYREKCDTRVVIGEGACENPLVLERPIMIAGMSFGALSVHAKRALGTAASRCGISTCTGEGGMHHEERRYSDKLVMQYLPSRYGMNPYDLKKADMIEIGCGQGAKPGTGGVLLGLKMSDEVAEMRDLPEGVDQRSPCRHPDWMGADDLYMKLEEIREVTEYKVPISIKVGAARIANDVRIAAKAGVDAIVFDGMEGGTAASPTIQLDHAGIPTVAAIAEAAEALAEVGKKDKMKLIVGGGIRNGADAAKCIALGRRRGLPRHRADHRHGLPQADLPGGLRPPRHLALRVPALPHRPLPGRHHHAAAEADGAARRGRGGRQRHQLPQRAHHGDPALRPRLRQEPGE